MGSNAVGGRTAVGDKSISTMSERQGVTRGVVGYFDFRGVLAKKTPANKRANGHNKYCQFDWGFLQGSWLPMLLRLPSVARASQRDFAGVRKRALPPRESAPLC
jgi:hypothetical protein